MWRRREDIDGCEAVEMVREGSERPALVAIRRLGVVVVIGPRGIVGGGAGPAADRWFARCRE